MSLSYVPVDANPTQTAQAENRGTLARGVVGIKCTIADEFSKHEDVIPAEVLREMRNQLHANDRFGTCEVYENGAVNIFLRHYTDINEYTVIGVFIYRP